MSGQRKRERGLFGQTVFEPGDREIVHVAVLTLRIARRHFSDVIEADLSTNYATGCDPRLNYHQSLEMAFLLARKMAA